MSEVTQEDALRQAAALAGQALRETEARCAVLGQYISDCDRAGAAGAGCSAALRELHVLQANRRGLLRRRSLIQEALDCAVGERPVRVPLLPPPDRAVRRVQRQVQIRGRRRS
jgi:hypothetical protein